MVLRLNYQHARVLWFGWFYCLGLAWHSDDWVSLAAPLSMTSSQHCFVCIFYIRSSLYNH